MNLNWYPPADPAQPPEPGQYRIGPHTDFGTVTVLDREPGRGGLQIYTAGGRWIDAPYDPAALTVNIGDLLARWTGDRWRSTRHRVLPPQAEAPDEDLLSLIFFYEANHDAVVESLPAPIGRTSFPPVVAHEYIGGEAGRDRRDLSARPAAGPGPGAMASPRPRGPLAGPSHGPGRIGRRNSPANGPAIP